MSTMLSLHSTLLRRNALPSKGINIQLPRFSPNIPSTSSFSFKSIHINNSINKTRNFSKLESKWRLNEKKSNENLWNQPFSSIHSNSAKKTHSFGENLNRRMFSSTKKEKKELVDDRKESTHTVLIDGSALFYRSYHAHSYLHNGAIYGYVRYLLSLRRTLTPFHNIVVLQDSPRKTNFRTQLFADYKKNRSEIPQSLKDQFASMVEAAQVCGIPSLKVEGYEADDLIATYCRIAKEQGHKVTIVSPDKDLLQLVDDSTYVYDIVDKSLITPEHVSKKWGVPSNQIGDLLSLTGDVSDNIPGVLGEKTAIGVLKEYGSLKNLLDNVDNLSLLKPKQASVIQQNVAKIKQAIQLVSLVSDIPNVAELDLFKKNPIPEADLFNFLDSFRFVSLINRWKKEHKVGEIDCYPPDNFAFITRKVKEETKTEDASPKEVQESTETVAREEGKEIPAQLSHEDFVKVCPKGVTLVRDRETARKVVDLLTSDKYNKRYHAIDTEVVDLDLEYSPVGQGNIICMSIYCGPDANFGEGPRIWIDNMGECKGVLDEFKDYLEDETIKKVYHNYSFDYHILAHNGIRPRGFSADTMHMARLWDSSRLTRGGYSLQGILQDLQIPGIDLKRSIKERFSSPKIKKDGTEGKALEHPDLTVLQSDLKYLGDWIDYSTFDTEGTWFAREKLEELLDEMSWMKKGWKNLTMWDYYQQEWLPFGELLVDIEEIGIRVDTDHLKKVEKVAIEDYKVYGATFGEWAASKCPGAKHMNIDSDAQKQQLFFAPAKGKNGKVLEETRLFDRENVEGLVEEGKKKALKKIKFEIKGLGMPAIEVTDSGLPAVSSKVLRELAGKNPKAGKFGIAYKFFGEGEEGKKASLAIDSLLEASTVQTLLSTFIAPLQTMTDSNSRIHTSLNVNTETGRLSSRRPNLQNQPSLEKDKYKIRHAFTAAPGKLLIVADYSQLELRLLAHITNCKSMIEAFHKGGDFHSRTAIGMYPEIAKAVEKGEVLLEWDNSKGEPPVPLLKDKFASERRKAKVLNFSIAYGKTAHGLAKDWGVSLNEAKETLDRWYRDRPEVKKWQEETIKKAIETGSTRTLMGRYRKLPDIHSTKVSIRNHNQRASINTPLQGGAADVVIRAMIKLSQNRILNKLGWKQVLQVHDEIILEGPEASAKEAVQVVNEVMRNPLDEPLLIKLEVDGKFAKTWYEAK
eukprot:TRINITY_DN5861_c0_g1_i1.p1 TRINITY_DN5861_c0_g1~~TRINITY_DN5861_c0_g1_i1.p1  ORF type:complete len:1203 (-),score=391.20 TRINITY_DN5861_c0_g1_i1:7-3588(-)